MQVLDAPPPNFGLMRFATDEAPAPLRFEAWRDIISRKLLRLSIDPLSEAPFRADAMLRSQHGLTIGVGEIGASINRRTRDIVATDNDDLVLIANLDGPFVIDGPRGDLTLGPGEATLVSCAEVARYVRPSAGRLLCARLPRAALARLAPRPEARTGEVIAANSAPLRMLRAYAGGFWDEGFVSASPLAGRLIVDHVCDLVALAVGAEGDGAEFANARGGRAGRLQAVRNVIEARIGPHDFGVDDVALSVGVSPRYVRKLLEAEGWSFSGYVTERRLERARAMLTGARFAQLTVSAIAFDVGFGDLSYFNRAFRRRYQRTPSDVRAEAVATGEIAARG
jgi:AraC-like DNA-binding protein